MQGMRTINLQTVYQLILTALLLGACLGMLGQRLPSLTQAIVTGFAQPIVAAPAPSPMGLGTADLAAAPQNQDVTTSKSNDANVQVEVEVHTRGNASAEARALGPGNTEVKTSTEGEGDGRSAAYVKAPEIPSWSQPVLQPTAQPLSGLPSDPLAASKAVVNEPMVNLRNGPDLTGAVMGTAQRGQEFAVIGRNRTNTWWLVCCDQGQQRWLYHEVVYVTGNLGTVPVIDAQLPVGIPNAPLVNTAATPTIAPPMPTAIPPAQYEFLLTEQAQFEEQITPRIFLYVYQTLEGLDGYTARVRKDGHDLPVTQRTTAGLPGMTWPIPNDRQRHANLKLEFPNVSPAGLWEVQLIDAAGKAVGPIATFRLQPNDRNQEMYVKYRKR
jgi:hypothetical protein